jgi:hypothetical protein
LQLQPRNQQNIASKKSKCTIPDKISPGKIFFSEKETVVGLNHLYKDEPSPLKES